VFVDVIVFSGNSIVCAKKGPGINLMCVPSSSTYSWAKINCKFPGIYPKEQ
jgi:hypothetical protein